MQAQTFTEAVETFLDAADSWLADEDAPTVAALRGAAKVLDSEVTASMLSAYRLLLLALSKRKPETTAEEDELGKLLGGDPPA